MDRAQLLEAYVAARGMPDGPGQESAFVTLFEQARDLGDLEVQLGALAVLFAMRLDRDDRPAAERTFDKLRWIADNQRLTSRLVSVTMPCYHRMVTVLQADPGEGRGKIEALLVEAEQRARKADAQLVQVHLARHSWHLHTGERDVARTAFGYWLAEATDRDAEHALVEAMGWHEFGERARAEGILRSVPLEQWVEADLVGDAMALHAWLRLYQGDPAGAQTLAREVLKDQARGRSAAMAVSDLAEMAAVLTITHCQQEGLRALQRLLPLAEGERDGEVAMRFWRYAARTARGTEPAEGYARQAFAAAQEFDERNGTGEQSRLVREVLNLPDA